MFRNGLARGAFAPRKPRHPLLRVAFGLLGLAVLCVLVFFSVFVGAAMIAVGIVYKLLRSSGKPRATGRGQTLDGEYRVVSKPVLPLSR